MNSVNEILSDRLRVVPLKDGEVREFRLIKTTFMDSSRKDDITGEVPLVKVGEHWFSSKETILDPFEKGDEKTKLIMNIVGVKPIALPDGQTKLEPIIESLKFDEMGYLRCDINTFNTCVFACRSNKNVDNTYRNKRVKAQFFEVKRGESTQKGLDTFDIRIDALNWIKMGSKEEILEILNNLPAQHSKNINKKSSLDDIKLALFNVGDNFPAEILKASTSKEGKGKIAIVDAERYDVIIYDSKTRLWYWRRGESDPICEVSVDVDKVQGLYDHLYSNDGGRDRTKLFEEMKTIYEAVE